MGGMVVPLLEINRYAPNIGFRHLSHMHGRVNPKISSLVYSTQAHPNGYSPAHEQMLDPHAKRELRWVWFVEWVDELL